MKNYCVKSVLFAFVALSCNHLFARELKSNPDKAGTDELRNGAPLNPASMLTFIPDVVMKPALENQTDVKIATAFNGWNYSVFTTHGGANDGIFVMQSKDHGVTWRTLFSSSGFFYSADLAVCGNDTNTLVCYLSSILYDSTSGNHTFFVTKINARTGAIINAAITETFPDTLYDVAIAHDYLHPASGATPYSVEVVYSKHGSAEDSVIAWLSIDGGISFTNRKMVDTSTDRFGKLALSYGYSPGFPAGCYFVAFEQHIANEKYGHIKLSRTDSLVTDSFTIPVYIDSVYSAVNDTEWSNHASNPSISIQNSIVNNDSSGLTAVVLWESSYNGTPDIDCVGAYSYQAGSSSGAWNYTWVDYFAAYHTYQPDICYDETQNKFLVTYWDSTRNQLRYYDESFNMPTPAIWNLVGGQYNDRVGSLVNPYPQVTFDPLFNSADFAWNEIRTSFSTALYDAQNSWSIVPEQQHAFGFSSHFPNPASDDVVFNFELDKTQSVSLELYDVVGNKISANTNENLEAGSHQIKIDVSKLPAGYYTSILTTGDGRYGDKILVVH